MTSKTHLTPNGRASIFGASVLGQGHAPGLRLQVLAEYLPIVTDAQRFEHPLAMREALERADAWWNLAEMRGGFPSSQTVALFLEWMTGYGLGRKRLLDTLLAAPYASNGFHCLLTTDAKGFRLFGELIVVAPDTGVMSRRLAARRSNIRRATQIRAAAGRWAIAAGSTDMATSSLLHSSGQPQRSGRHVLAFIAQFILPQGSPSR